jgi:hypothetical protein
VSNPSNWEVSCTGGGVASINNVTSSPGAATVSLNITQQPSLNQSCTLEAKTTLVDTAGNELTGTLASRSVTYTRKADVLTFNLSKTQLIYGESLTLAAQGGVPPYTFEKLSGL